MSNNVISFPAAKIVKPNDSGLPSRNIDEIEDYGNYVGSELASLLIIMLAEEGADGIKDENFYKDVALILEATKACVYRLYNEHHLLNALSDDIFRIVDSNSDQIVVELRGEGDE